MLKQGFMLAWRISQYFLGFLIPVAVVALLFILLCLGWVLYFRFCCKMTIPSLGFEPIPQRPLLYRIFVNLPKRYALDIMEREPGFFRPHGIHMFCGEQGSGKTMACTEMMLRLQQMYPEARLITNYAVASEDDELTVWQQLLTYTNGHKGVIVGIDELQNWFQSGRNQLPVEMLEVVTQNRKNCRILRCTAQVFTRVNKGLREQVTMVYNPHTFLGCLTVVVKRKPIFDSEGNVIEMKYRGMYCFVHDKRLRDAYDTYKVIHTLAKEGFKERPAVTNVNIAVTGNRK